MIKDVFIISLLTGQDVIAQIEDSKDPFAIVVTRPFVVMLKDTREGLQMGLIPYFPLVEQDGMLIQRSAIVSIGTPVDEVLNRYKEQIGEIIIPSNQIQLA